MIPKKC